MTTQFDKDSQDSISVSMNKNKIGTSSWAGIVCQTTADKKDSSFTSDTSLSRIADRSDKNDFTNKEATTTVPLEMTTQGDDYSNSLAKKNQELNSTETLGNVVHEELSIVVHGKVSVPTVEVDPSELSEFIEIKRAQKEKIKKKDTLSMKTSLIPQLGKSKCKDKLVNDNNRVKKINDQDELKSKVLNKTLKSCHNHGIPSLVHKENCQSRSNNGQSVDIEAGSQDKLNENSNVSFHLKPDSEEDIENIYVPAPAPAINVWEKRKNNDIVTPVNLNQNQTSTNKYSNEILDKTKILYKSGE